MRRDVKKFLFVGSASERDAFFEEAQREGIIHFIDATPSRPRELPPIISNLVAAIKVLRGLPTAEQEQTRTSSDLISNAILTLHHEIERLEEEERLLGLEMARIEIFGDFIPEDIAYIEEEGECRVQFYCAKHDLFDDATLPAALIYVGTAHSLDYFVAINEVTMQFEGMIEMKVDKPLGQLRQQRQHAIEKRHACETELKEYAKYNRYLHQALIDKMNDYNLVVAKEGVSIELDESLFAVNGWVPESKVALLPKVVHKKQMHYEEVLIEADEVAPTCLENENVAQIGEDLVRIYDTPSNSDKDPSLWVLGFFSLFFAFIVGDGGYGCIFLAIALYLQFKFRPTKKLAKRMITLTFILAISCIGWGVLTHSFFGLNFGPHSPLQRASLVSWLVEKKVAYHQSHNDATFQHWVSLYPQISVAHHPKVVLAMAAKERGGKIIYEMFDHFSDSIMLELALFVGIVHIALSFLRYLRRHWAGIGWIAFIIGGYFYFPLYIGAVTMMHYLFGLDLQRLATEGQYLMAGGMGAAFVLALIQHRLFGMLEVMTLIQVFGDILSYLRLYALGLAGGIVSATVNDLASSMFVVFGLIVIIAGHLINITLSVMGGVIHGLRLNFIEWYHYSFEGGGKLFSPLRKLETD